MRERKKGSLKSLSNRKRAGTSKLNVDIEGGVERRVGSIHTPLLVLTKHLPGNNPTIQQSNSLSDDRKVLGDTSDTHLNIW